MNYELSSLQLKLKSELAVFCTEKIPPEKKTCGDAGFNMKEAVKNTASAGYLGLSHEEKYGGKNYDLETLVIAAEELSKANASVFLSVYSSSMLFGMPVKKFGTEEQKQKYLPGIIKGDIIGCYAMTEEESGSDDSRIKTTAVKKDGKWIINGRKLFVTNAPIADVCLVSACTDGGITYFIVSKDNPGFKTGSSMSTLGCRDVPVSEVIIENCEVTGKDVLGDAGKGLAILNSVNNYFKLGVACLSLGIGMACMEKSWEYAEKRNVSGKPLLANQEISHKLADMMLLTDLSRLIILKAAWASDNNDPEAETLAACAKLFASEGVTQISDMALHIQGGHGYIEDSYVQMLFRDARVCEIIGGTSEIQRKEIAASVIAQF